MDTKKKISNYGWYEKIMNANLWIAIFIFVIEVLIAISNLLTGSIDNIVTYGINYVLIPSVLNIAFLVVGRLIMNSKKTMYIVVRNTPIICSTAICLVVSIFHAEVASALYIFIFPVILSAILGEKKYTLKVFIADFLLLICTIIYKILFTDVMTVESNFMVLSVSAIVILCVTFYAANSLIEHEKKKIDEIRTIKISKQVLEEKIMHDSLTHIFNPGGFYNILEREINHANKYKSALSLVVMDIDDFKVINDTFGHERGNIVLCKFANELKLLVEGKGYACRFGGDEFTLILPLMTAQQTYEIAKEFFENLKMYRFAEIDGGTITLSAAVGEYQGECNTHDFFEKVDRAMYRIKNNGKNNITICNDSVII